MPDIILHRLPFGGMAFEPVTEAGEDWLWGYCEEMGGTPFTNDDACMTDFGDTSVGFEPQDVESVAMDAILAGLTLAGAA